MQKKNETKSPADWREELSPEAYRITREHGTERAFSHPYNDEKRDGTFRCICCGKPLFESDRKYDSGSGWPSFTAPADETAIAAYQDGSLGMQRTEVRCAECEAHLGHVFPDGPGPDGLRYCINGAALDFDPAADDDNEI